jgi:hypothetical protein
LTFIGLASLSDLWFDEGLLLLLCKCKKDYAPHAVCLRPSLTACGA